MDSNLFDDRLATGAMSSDEATVKQEHYQTLLVAAPQDTASSCGQAASDALPAATAFFMPINSFAPQPEQLLVPFEALPTLYLQQPSFPMQLLVQQSQQDDCISGAPHTTEVLLVQHATLETLPGPSPSPVTSAAAPGPSPTRPTSSANTSPSPNKFRGLKLPTVLPRIAPAATTPSATTPAAPAAPVAAPPASPELPLRAPSTRRRLQTTSNGAGVASGSGNTRTRNESTMSQSSCASSISSASSASCSGSRSSCTSSDSDRKRRAHAQDDADYSSAEDDGDEDEDEDEEEDDDEDEDADPNYLEEKPAHLKAASHSNAAAGSRARGRRPRGASKSAGGGGGRSRSCGGGALSFTTEQLTHAPWAEFTQRPVGTPRLRLKQWLLRLVSRRLVPGLEWRAGPSGDDYFDADTRTRVSSLFCSTVRHLPLLMPMPMLMHWTVSTNA